MPSGFGGVMSGAAIVFFAFIGFDAVSTTAEETKNPQRDLPIGMIASLIICTLLYVLMSGVLTGMKKYTTYLGDSAAVATAFAGKPWAQALISAGALGRTDLGACSFFNSGSRAFSWPWRAMDCCHNILPGSIRAFGRRYVTTIWTGIFVGGVAMLTDIGSLADLTNIGTLFAFALVCVGVIVLRKTDPTRPRPFRVPFVPVFPLLGVFLVRRSDAQPADRNLAPVLRLARPSGCSFISLQCAPQPASPRHRYRRNRKRIPADRAVGHTTVGGRSVTAEGVKQRDRLLLHDRADPRPRRIGGHRPPLK